MKKAKDVLVQLFSNPIFNQKMKEEGDFYHNFFAKWKEIIGDKLFGHVKINDIHQNKIIIEIDHPAYIQMFKFKEKKILKIINYKYPKLKVKGFRIIVKSEVIQQKTEKREKTEEQQENSENLNWSSVKNENLRDIFKRLYKNVKE